MVSFVVAPSVLVDRRRSPEGESGRCYDAVLTTAASAIGAGSYPAPQRAPHR